MEQQITTKAVISAPGIDRVVPIILQNWRLIVVSLVAVLILTLGALVYMDPRYEVNARILIKLGREMAAPLTVTDTAQVIPTQKRPEDINSEIEIMKSPDLLRKLVEYFGEDYFYAEPPATTLYQKIKKTVRIAVKWIKEKLRDLAVFLGIRRQTTPLERVVGTLQKSLEIEAIRKTDVVFVKFKTKDPEAGVEIVNKFIELYLERHLEVFKAPRVRQFFSAESDLLKKKLRKAELELSEFRQKNALWSPMEQRRVILDSLQRLRDDRARMEGEIDEILARIDYLDNKIVNFPEKVKISAVKARNPLIDELRSRLVELEGELQTLRVSFGDDHRKTKEVKNEISRINGIIISEKPYRIEQETTGQNEKRMILEKKLLLESEKLYGLKSRYEAQKTLIDSLEKELEALERNETSLKLLERKVARLENNYKLYTDSLEESRIADEMDRAKISNVTVITPPTFSPTPVWPPLRLMFIGAFIVGIGGSLGVLFLLDVIRPSIRRRQDIEAILDTPVLARLQETKEFDEVLEVPYSVVLHEEMERLCAEIEKEIPDGGHIVLVGPKGGEGTTTISTLLARTIASITDKKVMLVDANLFKPRLHEIFNVENEPGLNNWRWQESKLPASVKIEHNIALTTAGSGESKDTITRMNYQGRLQKLMEEYRKQYNYIIWDCPPMGMYADAGFIAKYAEGVIVIVETDCTRMDKLAYIRDQLRLNKANILGSVMNRNGRYYPIKMEYAKKI